MVGKGRFDTGAQDLREGLAIAEKMGDTAFIPRFLNTLRKLGIQTHVWTINEVDDMTRLANLGVDGIMTDDASALKQVLQALGRW